MIDFVKVIWELFGNQLFGSPVLLACFGLLAVYLLLSTFNVEPVNILLICLPLSYVLAFYISWIVPVFLILLAFNLGYMVWKMLGQQY